MGVSSGFPPCSRLRALYVRVYKGGYKPAGVLVQWAASHPVWLNWGVNYERRRREGTTARPDARTPEPLARSSPRSGWSRIIFSETERRVAVVFFKRAMSHATVRMFSPWCSGETIIGRCFRCFGEVFHVWSICFSVSLQAVSPYFAASNIYTLAGN